jgi:ABC-2 type transport system ATP-binding protein
MTTVLQLIDVHKSFGNHQVLDGFSLSVGEGEIWGLLGPNGCGKSTVLNIVCRLLSCDQGQVNLMGKAAHLSGVQARSQIGFCPQRIALYPDLLPAENLLFFSRLYGFSDKESHQRVAELMRDFELDDFSTTRVGQLSGGWQQRLHLAVSLINRPALLLLDEPTSAVDVEARMEIGRLIDKLRNKGTTILMTSHDLAEAERLCSKVALMHSGKLVAQGSVAELLAKAPGQAVAKVQSEDHEAIRQLTTMKKWPVRQHGADMKLFVPQTLSLRDILDALGSIRVTSISLHPVTLEDAYLELVGDIPSMS